MLTHIQDNTHKAYVALQSYVTSPSYIPIPDVVHTDRPKLTRGQIAARYLQSVEGNPNIDINKASARGQDKTPKMVQRKSNAQTKDEWPSLAPSGIPSDIKTREVTRTLLDVQNCEPELSVSKYLARVGSSAKVTHEWIGGDPDAACLSDTPEFIICSEQYLPSTKVLVSGYPSQELQLRSHLGSEASTDSEKTNAEIHNALQNNKATRIYLTAEQLESYTSWQRSHGGSQNFQYIRVDDTEKVNARVGLAWGGVAAAMALMVPAALGCATLWTRKDRKSDEEEPQNNKSSSARVANETKDAIEINNGKPKNNNITRLEGLTAVSTSTESSDTRSQSNEKEPQNRRSPSDLVTNDVVVDMPEEITRNE